MHFHVWLCITSHQIAMFASFVKGVFRLFLGERGRVIMLSASERMWSPVRPIDWRCWWIAPNVQQAIRCCSVCRPVGWTAPIRPDIKRLCSITLKRALYACPMIKSMGSICHFSWGKAGLQIIRVFAWLVIWCKCKYVGVQSSETTREMDSVWYKMINSLSIKLNSWLFLRLY